MALYILFIFVVLFLVFRSSIAVKILSLLLTHSVPNLFIHLPSVHLMINSGLVGPFGIGLHIVATLIGFCSAIFVAYVWLILHVEYY